MTQDEINARVEARASRFISWRDNLPKENRGGITMYNVPGHYKWLNDTELFQHYFDVVFYEQEQQK